MTKRVQFRLLSATILAGGLLATPAVAQTNSETSASDDFLHPYTGDINPFTGDINPFTGDISPFSGDINPFRGDINPFYGDINPFWGDISPFWGDINPFTGDINPFTGDINPFWGDISPFTGDINPFTGDISPFWETAGPAWGDINADWNALQTGSGDVTYADVSAELASLFNAAESVFGDAIENAGGSSFEEAILSPLLDKYGLDLDDADSLASFGAIERSFFFLDFYDSLMSYSGLDRVDHWMPSVNWSPALALEYNAGRNVVVGLVDFSLGDAAMANLRVQQGDRDYLDFNHGAAVASLIAAPIDGSGIMGVAPDAVIVAHNPFDESLTAGWSDVAGSVQQLSRMQADIINMSLGVPGWTFHQDWADVFTSRAVARQYDPSLFVVAAGNDGSPQSLDVDWSSVGRVNNILIVGSVGPTGQISNFSNRPGNACFLTGNGCQPGYRLMDRFLVAPGELVLVDDGEGGVTRQSGTSFAAPLVSGAAALVEGQWPWLSAGQVANVLLDSARDLGDPGVDAIYGAGLLDIEAALNPIDWDSVVMIDWRGRRHSVSDLYYGSGRLRFRSPYRNAVPVFELDQGMVRDYKIPLEDLRRVYNSSDSWSEADAYDYFADRLGAAYSRYGFNEQSRATRLMGQSGDTRLTAFASTADRQSLGFTRSVGFQTGLSFENTATGQSAELGIGEGALALSAQTGFGLFSDHRPASGGVNPVLGFASGGAYAATRWQAGPLTTMRAGITSTHEELEYVMPGTGEVTPLVDGLEAYEAMALNFGLTRALTPDLTLDVDFTHLYEATGLLGAQASGPLSFSGGSDTSSVSIGVGQDLSHRLRFNASATLATTSFDTLGDGAFTLAENIVSTAYQFSLEYAGLLNRQDVARVSLIQPLHTENGALRFNTTDIVDRTTGELGLVSQDWEIGGDRAMISEVIYSAPLPGRNMSFTGFVRVNLNETSTYTLHGDFGAGASIRWAF
ncbi:MAG: S8 family serine peptidase [Alphaproteobacteria bacterium]|nr:S8 family serine peptidase [Alphaproteobacteria bacterium]